MGKPMTVGQALSLVQNPLSAGTTSNNLGSTAVDMSGFEGVCFITTVGVTTTTVTLKAQSSTDNVTFADLPNLTCNTTASNGLLFVDVYAPVNRYVRAVINSTGAQLTGGTVAIQYGAKFVPQTPSTGTPAVMGYAQGVGTT